MLCFDKIKSFFAESPRWLIAKGKPNIPNILKPDWIATKKYAVVFI